MIKQSAWLALLFRIVVAGWVSTRYGAMQGSVRMEMNPFLIKLVQRIREQFQEVPALRLTLGEAARFWGLDAQTCESVLRTFEQTGFLKRSPDGRYQIASGVSKGARVLGMAVHPGFEEA